MEARTWYQNAIVRAFFIPNARWGHGAMTEKPTYEELRQRVRKLEKEVSELKGAEEESRLVRDKFAGVLAAMCDGVDITTYDYRVGPLKTVTGTLPTSPSQRNYRNRYVPLLLTSPSQRCRTICEKSLINEVERLNSGFSSRAC